MIVANPVTHDPRVTIEAQSLSRHGYDVTIIAWDRLSQFPREETDGVSIVRLRNTPYMRFLRRDLLRLRPWWRLAYARAMELHRDSSFSVVHCHDLDTLPTGVWLKRGAGMPLLYDAHEIWGYMVGRDVPGVIASHFLRKEKRLVKDVDAVITVSEPIKEYFEELTSAPVSLVLNAKPPMVREYTPPKNDVLTLVYIGTLNRARFILELIEAVDVLEGVRLVVAGFGKDHYLEAVRKACWIVPNAEFVGKVAQRDVLPMTLAADAVVCLTDPRDRNNSIGVGNKLFEAMACGRPILVSKDTYLAEFTEKHGVGFAVEHSLDGVRDGLIRLRDDPGLRETLGKRALQRALEEFNWGAQEERLLGIYKRLGLA